jgi:hypothetical protein
MLARPTCPPTTPQEIAASMRQTLSENEGNKYDNNKTKKEIHQK